MRTAVSAQTRSWAHQVQHTSLIRSAPMGPTAVFCLRRRCSLRSLRSRMGFTTRTVAPNWMTRVSAWTQTPWTAYCAASLIAWAPRTFSSFWTARIPTPASQIQTWITWKLASLPFLHSLTRFTTKNFHKTCRTFSYVRSKLKTTREVLSRCF